MACSIVKIAFMGWVVNSSFIRDGRLLKPMRIKANKRYLIHDIWNRTSNPAIKSKERVIILTIIADFEESICGESKKLISPRPTEIKIKFDDLM